MELFADPITVNCRKVVAGLKLLGSDYTLTKVDYFKSEQKSDAFKAINPNAALPALRDGDLVLWESNAILQYAADKGGKEKKVRDFVIPVGAQLIIDDGQSVAAGTTIAKISREAYKTRDITGGLPRVAELFEARSPKDKGTLAEITGTVSFGKETKGKVRLQITDPDGKVYEELVPKEKNILVHEGQVVNKGELIVDGPADPQDILRLLGIEELARYITDEVQDVYRLQGVKINDKHIEVIVRQMLQKVRVLDSGETEFLEGENVDKAIFRDANDKSKKKKQVAARSEPLLLGITKASLTTQSFTLHSVWLYQGSVHWSTSCWMSNCSNGENNTSRWIL